MLTIITGPMFSGKSEELIDIYDRVYNKEVVICFKPSKDNRDGTYIKSRAKSNHKIPAKVIKSYDEILKYEDYKVILIDEAQFIKGDWRVLEYLSEVRDCHVYVAGLTLTSEQEVFGSLGNIALAADKIINVTATCHYCGRPAKFTKCLVDKKTRDLIGSDEYIPVCGQCLFESYRDEM